jgi:hypothetical protein
MPSRGLNSAWKWFRGLANLEFGTWCRNCGDSISPGDPFGQSEGVCQLCRSHD